MGYYGSLLFAIIFWLIGTYFGITLFTDFETVCNSCYKTYVGKRKAGLEWYMTHDCDGSHEPY